MELIWKESTLLTLQPNLVQVANGSERDVASPSIIIYGKGMRTKRSHFFCEENMPDGPILYLSQRYNLPFGKEASMAMLSMHEPAFVMNSINGHRGAESHKLKMKPVVSLIGPRSPVF